jgi:hypothetical protein
VRERESERKRKSNAREELQAKKRARGAKKGGSKRIKAERVSRREVKRRTNGGRAIIQSIAINVNGRQGERERGRVRETHT